MTILSSVDFVEEVLAFVDFGQPTHTEEYHWEAAGRQGSVLKATNEYWTSGQRQAHSLHEISYRACYKPQLPRFFIERLTEPGDAVYDPFMGRGTTLLEAWLLKRRPLGNDINPLSRVLLEPRINPPTLDSVAQRLDCIDLGKAGAEAVKENRELKVFYHPNTLRQIIALKEYLLKREEEGELDQVDRWIRMVAINRLTGHSTGFFSVYSMPPNQAVSIASQRKINERREQIPDERDIVPRILKKSSSLLRDYLGSPLTDHGQLLSALLTTAEASDVTGIEAGSAQLVVTSPPFLDVVNYQADNWLRCWFIGLDSSEIGISQLRNVDDWVAAMTAVMRDLRRIVTPGGHVAFEVGEVRGGKLLLEELVLPAGVEAGLDPVIIMINAQEFTKTANTWGVDNQKKGTNTNRIVIFQR